MSYHLPYALVVYSLFWACSVVFANRALLEGQEDQSILISGVSGAGKTETAKLLLGHLASVAGSEEGGVGSERIQHMVECTVVLESFGNAVMVSSVRSSDYCMDIYNRTLAVVRFAAVELEILAKT